MTAARRAFTLLELLVAMFIFALVVGSVYLTLTSGVDAFHKGERNMELYQSVRVGVGRMGKDLRQAVSPESPWSSKAEDERRGRMNPERLARMELEAALNPELYGQSRKESDIIFQGSSQQVTFVMPEILPGSALPFDLRQIRYSVDSKEKQLIRETVNSLMLKRMMEWRALRAENETEYRLAHSHEVKFKPIRSEIAENIESMDLRYYDGERWRENWDSNQYEVKESKWKQGRRRSMSERDLRENPEMQEERQRLGLPDAVKVTLTLTNKSAIQLITEIPGKDMDRLYNETAFDQETKPNVPVKQ